jgi:hypothetical protein
VGDDLEQLLSAAKIARESMVDRGLQFARRSYQNGHYYFISNPGKTTLHEWVDLQVNESNCLLFDPMTLNAGIAHTRKFNGHLQVMIQLSAGSSCILQTGNKPYTGNSFPNYNITSVDAIIGDWNISFLSGGPTLPATRKMDHLVSWTTLPDENLKSFSGTALYSLHFPKPMIVGDHYLIDLGQVEESAEVILNGKRIAVLLGPSYQTVIDQKQLKEDNLLEIKVTNGLPNRIADLERKGVTWKKFYNTNFPAKLAENRGTDGKFTAIKWQPKVAGLLGPVMISALQQVK